MYSSQPTEFVLDVGGEGRYHEAWNLNPSSVVTIGKNNGRPIPRRIPGRADDIPLADGSVDRLIVERTPLRLAALKEIARVIAATGTVVLRHVRSPHRDPHALAMKILPGRASHRTIYLDGQVVQETRFRLCGLSSASVGQTAHGNCRNG